ncbi:hypothetical protein BCR33DRAFT_442948 [Rhizoclosmatium globosum]|uniref:Uncharacterized protein n=1 Tax=Rhizoclosmatium globosum TaxID=329046 RepID=A0A1Y2BTD6_9FUNG|nr:hypothetical protein BCR33DRAFT_442948 [Rhizoclosmatium globosum]|eukprot:ORY38003.1 hypothetical protein BCR33DRAFT_442948 [Rhizoclosmatium globosum]
MTLYTFECDPTGTPTRLLVSNTDAGNGTIANPGNNNTLGNTVGGSVGVDLNYTKDSFGFTDVYVWANSNIFKSSYYFVTNQVTGEKVTFGNDWTLSFLSNKIRQIISIVSFPIFAAVIECNTGYILGTSSFAPLLLDDQLLTLPQVNDVYLQDFYAVVSSKFGPVQNLSQSLNNAAQFIHVNFPGTENWFVDRKMGTSNWKVGVNSCTITGKQLLFVIYMNVDSVEEQLNKLSVITGDIMAGIITVFVLIGIGFALVISRQLLAVVTQIKLAQDLKLDDMLNEEHERYSFIFELAELQKAFNGMMFVFKDFLKRNHQMTRRVGPGNSEAVKPSDNINFGSKPTNNSSN